MFQAEAVCAKTVTLGNYAKWADVLMHIHIGSMGKLVNVKVVSWLAYLHIATHITTELKAEWFLVHFHSIPHIEMNI